MGRGSGLDWFFVLLCLSHGIVCLWYNTTIIPDTLSFLVRPVDTLWITLTYPIPQPPIKKLGPPSYLLLPGVPWAFLLFLSPLSRPLIADGNPRIL